MRSGAEKKKMLLLVFDYSKGKKKEYLEYIFSLLQLIKLFVSAHSMK